MSDFQQRFAGDEDVVARRYDSDERSLLVVDFGPGAEGHVEIVDGTAIVVRGDDQYDLELPPGESRASMNNGVVTIEVKQ